MAFAYTSLTNLAHGNGFTLWHYVSADAKATVDAAGYFDSAADLLKVNDVVICIDSNTPTATIMVVLSNTGTVVDVSDGTAISLTDSR
jgi:hypothetical protein|tara:strand:- start:382 stop:645 length:264 start_codon:yes stop_codon:yes gene_type:complete